MDGWMSGWVMMEGNEMGKEEGKEGEGKELKKGEKMKREMSSTFVWM